MTARGQKTAPPKKGSPVEVAAAGFLCLAAVLLAGTLVQQRLARAAPRPSDDPLSGTLIVPAVDQEGVVVVAGSGQLLSVDSSPGGAQVTLNGVKRGETPFSSDFSCDDGKPVTLELALDGYRRASYSIACAPGTTRVLAKLKRK